MPMSARTLDGTAPVRLRPRARRQLALAAAVLLAVLAAAGLGWRWWTDWRFYETTDDAYVGGNVTAIAPHVAGFVATIAVQDNQYVRAGQILVRLEGRDASAALAHAEAAQAAAAARAEAAAAALPLQRARLAADRAAVLGAAARLRFARQEAARYRRLEHSSAGTRQQAERAIAALAEAAAAARRAVATSDAAAARLVVLRADLSAVRAALAEARAATATARLDLGYTIIRAPIAGYIGDRAAQRGAYVARGQVLMSLVPARGLWIDANFKEDALARLRPGQPVSFTADALPGQTLHGHVGSLAPATGAVFSVIPPQNATGNFTRIVQRVPVRILLDGAAASLGALRPGLSTTVSVDTRQETR